jgi:hypothetical protein
LSQKKGRKKEKQIKRTTTAQRTNSHRKDNVFKNLTKKSKGCSIVVG